MKRPTQRDIAEIAQVSHVTVSLALRGHRSIPAATRGKIEVIARKIGYRPDPALQALMSYRRGAKPSKYQGTLAWINNYKLNPDKLRAYFPNYYLGAEERCVELGYQLEEFRLANLDQNFGRLSKVLLARNVQGVLFPPQEGQRHITKAAFAWENFSMVAFGFSLLYPKLDVVTNALYRSARLAVQKLRSLGYRRIGFVVESRLNERTDDNFLAGFLIEQRRFLPSARVPIHFLPTGKKEEERTSGFLQWFSRHKPEGILFVTSYIPDCFRALTSAERNGCATAVMDVPDGNLELSGISQNNRVIGRIAIDTLVGKIHANERGIPANPRRLFIDGTWMAGTTAPRVTGK
jgi:DNA-binding LacI/PurR family transcriptional regulator